MPKSGVHTGPLGKARFKYWVGMSWTLFWGTLLASLRWGNSQQLVLPKSRAPSLEASRAGLSALGFSFSLIPWIILAVYLTVSVMLYFEFAPPPPSPSYFRNYHSCFSVTRMLNTPISTGVVNPTAVRGQLHPHRHPVPSATSHCFLTCYTSRWQIPKWAADFPPLEGAGP